MNDKLWLKEYENCLNELYGNDLNIKKSIDIKRKHIPKTLYRFRALTDNGDNDYEFENLENDTIWLNSPKIFNDPYDTKPLYNPYNLYNLLNNDVSTKKLIENRDSKEVKDLFAKTFEEFCQTYRIGCFTKNEPTNILMWSHYAHYHEGYCVEYKIDETFEKHEIFWNGMCPVIYSDNIFDLSVYLYTMIKNAVSLIENKDNKHFNNIIFNLVALYKSNLWSYENEWRVVMDKNLYRIDNLINAPKPSAIYVGLNTSDRNKAILKNISRKRDIKLFYIKRCSDEYRLYIDENA